MEKGQAERLLPLLEEALAAGGAEWRDLDGLAVCTGPGNFTGIRIAVAAARGLAMSLEIPALGVTRLEALAAETRGPVEAAIDARRGGLWVQAFLDGAAVSAPRLVAAEAPAGAGRRIGAPGPDRADPVVLARLGAARLDLGAPPPAPLYLRPADATPGADAPPVLLDDA